jgi:hypothetical protein
LINKKDKEKHMNDLRMFWEEEEGLGTVEMVLLLAALVTIAILLRMGLLKFMKDNLDNIFNKANDAAKVDTP